MTTDDRPQIDLAKLYRTGEVAEFLELSKDTVLRMAKRGELPYRRTPGSAKRGGYRRFRGSDIMAVWLGMNQYM